MLGSLDGRSVELGTAVTDRAELALWSRDKRRVVLGSRGDARDQDIVHPHEQIDVGDRPAADRLAPGTGLHNGQPNSVYMSGQVKSAERGNGVVKKLRVLDR